MKPRIEVLPQKKLIGKHITTSFADDKTTQLWKNFMPRRKEITNALNTDLISMQLYGKSFSFIDFNANKEFEKWAAVEVSSFIDVPNEMETYTLPGGLYAVFLHKGAAATGAKTFRFILGEWLPNSIYTLDDRPHFEILGDKYKNDDPSSEEEIWIPIKLK